VPLSKFLIDAASADCDLSSAEGRARLSSQARPLWSALPDGALKRQLLSELAQQIGIGTPDLQQLWQRDDRGGPRRPREERSPTPGQAPAQPTDAGLSPYPTASSAPAPHGGAGAWSAPSDAHGRSGWGGGTGGGRGGWRKGPPPPPRMLGRQTASQTRNDRAVGLLLANASAWDGLSAEDHSMLAHLPAPHGPVFAWLEAQLHEHGPQPWSALREALRDLPFEHYACAEVEQATIAADSEAEREELAGVMNLLRRDDLQARADALATRVQQGDRAAFEEFKRVTERLKALQAGHPV
jgi:DNA primase